MNIKASYKYQLVDQKRSVIIYYAILLSLMIFLMGAIAVTVAHEDGTITGSSMNGMDLATAIFLFVTGLCSFKESFGMLMQNGISRKNIYIGRVLTTITLAFGMAMLDTIILLIFQSVSKISGGILNYSSMYEQFFYMHSSQISSFQVHVEVLIFDFVLYLTSIALGYLITNMFYRVNKTGKVALGAGVPVVLFVIFPVFDAAVMKGKISMAIAKGLDFAFGFTKQQPGRTFITFIITFLVFSVISWLLVRRADVKE